MKACEDMAHCFYQHKNRLQDDVVPVRQQRYRMNPNYATHVKEGIDKLLNLGRIHQTSEECNMALTYHRYAKEK